MAFVLLSSLMNKDQLKPAHEYYERYIQNVENIDILEALHKYGLEYLEAERASFKSLGDKVYEPGKWTIKDILQHIIDGERVFSYRAMRISRKDQTPLPSFDQDLFVANANAATRSIDDLLEEFDLVRRGTIRLFRSFSDEMMLSEGVCSGRQMSVLSIGYILTGHLIHHMHILKERYYPLI